MELAKPHDPIGGDVQAGASGRTGERSGIEYATFWQRVGAHLVDFVVLSPVTLALPLMTMDIRLFQLYWFVPGIAIALFYHVYLVHRYGGTPGKLILKIRIALLDGSPVTLKAASLRFSILFFLGLLSSIGMVMAVLSIGDEVYMSASGLDRIQLTEDFAPSWYQPLQVLTGVWILSEFITMLFNERRRAIHDFIGGTVVIRAS